MLATAPRGQGDCWSYLQSPGGESTFLKKSLGEFEDLKSLWYASELHLSRTPQFDDIIEMKESIRIVQNYNDVLTLNIKLLIFAEPISSVAEQG